MESMLAIYGSPRKGGNSDTLMDYFLKGTEGSHYYAERAYLRDLNILPCTGCRSCHKTGNCILVDDMVGFYEKLLHYKRIVMAFPVFFLGPPAIVKAFIDRVQPLWVRKQVLGAVQFQKKQKENGEKREGFLLSVGGYEKSEKIFSCNIAITKAFYSACGFRYSGALLYNGVDEADVLRKREDIRKDALRAGREFVGQHHSNL
jgi:multimeric flavodoxin WrbA